MRYGRRSLLSFLCFLSMWAMVGTGPSHAADAPAPTAPSTAPPAAPLPPAAPAPPAPAATPGTAAPAAAYEVWAIDQSDSSKDGGGTLYIYDGQALASDPKSAKPETIDLGDKFAEACKEATGFPKRPHMLLFTKDGKYAILSYVASGHVVFIDAASRAPIASATSRR